MEPRAQCTGGCLVQRVSRNFGQKRLDRYPHRGPGRKTTGRRRSSPVPAASVSNVPMLELKQIQGIVVSGYKDLPFSRFVFLKIKNVAGAKRWLDTIVTIVTTAAEKPKSVALNIAFTRKGLECLGLSDTISGFPREFEEGMAEPARSQQL